MLLTHKREDQIPLTVQELLYYPKDEFVLIYKDGRLWANAQYVHWVQDRNKEIYVAVIDRIHQHIRELKYNDFEFYRGSEPDPDPPDVADIDDVINHPSHYNWHPSGVECIDIVRHMTYNEGSAIAYIWRAKYKGNRKEDYEKAIWHLQDEINHIQ